MPKVAVLDDYQNVALSMADWSRVQAAASVEVFDRPLGLDEAAARLAEFDIVCLMRQRMDFPASLFERLPGLKLLVTTGTRNSTIDLGAAAARGVVVSHTRNGGSEHPTAELTWALILAAAPRLGPEGRNLASGGWQQSVGYTLAGRTLGLVGLGRIGSLVASIGRAFGMTVQAWSPNLTPERAAAGGAEFVSKSELFATSDVISLHLVLSPSTRGVVGAAELDAMRAGALLVNTARGPLVEEAALIERLQAERIFAALDVFDQEPLPADHPFRTLRTVTATPHLGYVTRETYAVFFQDMVEDIEAFLAGSPIRTLTS